MDAIGGAILITSKQPTDEFAGRISAGYDSGPGYRVGATVSGPISETVKYRLTASYLDTDGYIDNPYLQEEADPYEDLSARGLLVWEPSDGAETRKRSIYIFQRRQLEVPLLSVLDAPVFQASCERRAVSTTAVQALMMLNGQLVTEEAEHFARRVVREAGADRAAQIRRAFELALARLPSEEELRRALEFLDSQKQGGLVGLCRVLFNTNEFVYVD